MRRAGPDFCWLGLGILVVLLVLAVSGPVMRERDQAALLEGAVDLARHGDQGDRIWYNYDKQFLSYWVLAGVIDIAGYDAPGSDPAAVVELGNRAAAIFFCLSLLVALGCSPRRGMAFLPVAMAAFLTPALIFSVPLLASNIFSAGALLLLAAAMRGRRAGWANALVCAFLTAVAVGFRRDAALVLPALCLLGTTRFSIGGLLREKRHWTMAAAAVGMVLVGGSLVRGTVYRPDMIFDARLFGAYVGFGMAGAVVLLFWLPFRLVTSRRLRVMRVLTALALLLPLVLYAPYLYTPRHLFLSALLLFLVLILPRGELWWQTLRRRRLDRFVLWSSVLGSLTLWLIGFRFETIGQPAVVREAPTLYPTADGFWPMGCYREFLIRLSRADEIPIDHNQEIWEAWTRVREDRLPSGMPRVNSAGLRALGFLALKIKGRDSAGWSQGADFDLVEDRSLDRKTPGYSLSKGEVRDRIDWSNAWLVPLGGNEWRQIYLVEKWSGQERTLALPWVAQLAIVKALGPDDFHLRKVGQGGFWRADESRGHRIAAVYAEEVPAQDFRDALVRDGNEAELHSVEVAGLRAHVVSYVFSGALPPATATLQERAEWISRSVLPAFMSRANY